MSVDIPRSDRARVDAENLLELSHIDVDQKLSLLGGVARREAYVGVPIPRIATSPLQPRSLNVGLGNLPPGTHLRALVEPLLEELLIAGNNQSIVLDKERARELILLQHICLLSDSIEEHILGDVDRVTWL
jgi:hypothetical protein